MAVQLHAVPYQPYGRHGTVAHIHGIYDMDSFPYLREFSLPTYQFCKQLVVYEKIVHFLDPFNDGDAFVGLYMEGTMDRSTGQS